MRIVLGLVAVVAALYSAVAATEVLLVIADRERVTVFQQISARLGLGLGLLLFATACGFAAVLGRLDARADDAARLEAALKALLDLGRLEGAIRAGLAPLPDPPAPKTRRAEGDPMPDYPVMGRRKAPEDAMTEAARKLYPGRP